VLGRISPRSGVPVIMGLVSGAISLLAMTAYLTAAGADNQKYFSAALVVSIALIVLAYLLIFPAFVALRLREPGLDRPFRVPGGTRTAWLVTGLATGWSLLAAVCLLWPGLGTADPDAALPAGFASQRGQFELLVLVPIAAVITVTTAYCLAGRPRSRARRVPPPKRQHHPPRPPGTTAGCGGSASMTGTQRATPSRAGEAVADFPVLPGMRGPS
jgi:glutamate:GABA antiporter